MQQKHATVGQAVAVLVVVVVVAIVVVAVAVVVQVGTQTQRLFYISFQMARPKPARIERETNEIPSSSSPSKPDPFSQVPPSLPNLLHFK